MFTTFLEELRGFLGKGFFLAVFVPTLLSASAHLLLYLAVWSGLDKAWQQWSALPADVRVILLLFALTILSFIAYLIHNFQLLITRFFEGYWPNWPMIGWLREKRRALYLQKWQYLSVRVTKLDALVQADKEKGTRLDPSIHYSPLEIELSEVRDNLLTYFPLPGHWQQIRPTRIGNILRSSELYAKDHYGIDAVVVWTRLRPLLQGTVVETLQDKKIAMDFMLLMTVYAGTFTLIWCPILALWTTNWQLFLWCACGLPLAWLTYQNAVQNTLAYAEQIRAVFDLHRYELLKAMKVKIPVELEKERQLWEDISLFLHGNIPPTEIYQLAIPDNEAHLFLIAAPLPPLQPKG